VKHVLLSLLLLLPRWFVGDVLAQRAESGDADPVWQGDIAQFAANDFSTWRTGSWIRGSRQSEAAWWWVVGDTWYPYTQVTYPFPDPYTPPSFRQPTLLGRSRPEPGVLGEPYLYFYCPSTDQYYPYAATCEESWLPVRATAKGLREQALRSARVDILTRPAPMDCPAGKARCI
jgi:hypothetical protein